jgi:hypothetical protein
MKITLWKNIKNVSHEASAEGLTEIWKTLNNMDHLKSDAPTIATQLMASRSCKLALESGAHPFKQEKRKGFCRIVFTTEI